MHTGLGGQGAVLSDAGAVVVGGEAGGGRPSPTPVGAAISHVVVEGGYPVTDVVYAPLAGETLIGVGVAV